MLIFSYGRYNSRRLAPYGFLRDTAHKIIMVIIMIIFSSSICLSHTSPVTFQSIKYFHPPLDPVIFFHLIDNSKAHLGLLIRAFVLQDDAIYFGIGECNVIWVTFLVPSRYLHFFCNPASQPTMCQQIFQLR